MFVKTFESYAQLPENFFDIFERVLIDKNLEFTDKLLLFALIYKSFNNNWQPVRISRLEYTSLLKISITAFDLSKKRLIKDNWILFEQRPSGSIYGLGSKFDDLIKK